MNLRRAAALVAVVLLAWAAFNWVKTDRACDRATDGRMHATAIAAVAPHGWLPGDATVCSP